MAPQVCSPRLCVSPGAANVDVEVAGGSLDGWVRVIVASVAGETLADFRTSTLATGEELLAHIETQSRERVPWCCVRLVDNGGEPLPTTGPLLGCASSPNETLRLTLVRMSVGSSRTWRGVQPGYVFTTRAGLVGYYLDVRGEP